LEEVQEEGRRPKPRVFVVVCPCVDLAAEP
jgi:hypothetical protein